MSVTVVIPSYKRAEYLHTVLESVRRQTALGAISEIIVSENSDDTRPKAICEQFADLPIRYVQQTRSLPPIEHVHWIIDQAETPYTAMLHDDDWWYPTHLECALASFANPGTAAYFSNFVFMKNEAGRDATFHHPAMISRFAPAVTSLNPVPLSFEAVAALCYVFTPFHMSAMVARTPLLKMAANLGLKFSRPWYADRIMYPYLSVHGNLAFNPQVLAGIRIHALNDAKNYGQEERYEAHAEGSLKIFNLARTNGADIIACWEKIRISTPTAEFQEVFNVFQTYFGPASNAVFVKKPDGAVSPKPSAVKKIIRNLLPYGLVTYLNKR